MRTAQGCCSTRKFRLISFRVCSGPGPVLRAVKWIRLLSRLADMLPTRLNTVYFMRGLPVVFADVIFSTDGVPDDYSAYTFTARWRQSAGHAEYIELAVDDSESDQGHIIVTATGSQSLQMTRLGVWEVQAAIDPADPTPMIAGNAVMVPDVIA